MKGKPVIVVNGFSSGKPAIVVSQPLLGMDIHNIHIEWLPEAKCRYATSIGTHNVWMYVCMYIPGTHMGVKPNQTPSLWQVLVSNPLNSYPVLQLYVATDPTVLVGVSTSPLAGGKRMGQRRAVVVQTKGITNNA